MDVDVDAASGDADPARAAAHGRRRPLYRRIIGIQRGRGRLRTGKDGYDRVSKKKMDTTEKTLPAATAA